MSSILFAYFAGGRNVLCHSVLALAWLLTFPSLLGARDCLAHLIQTYYLMLLRINNHRFILARVLVIVPESLSAALEWMSEANSARTLRGYKRLRQY